MKQKMERRLLSIEGAARYLGLKLSRLRTAISRGEVPFLKIGRLVRFDQKTLDQWVETKQTDQEKRQRGSHE